ncbi:putative lipid II flippase FtsW [Caldalkalibacillus salinus]|uniref:putative lipid II flippase FtsW n=1 Tax=Caldalkalibacillus salinus TaxID=2803787 RepID=UPI003B00B6A2
MQTRAKQPDFLILLLTFILLGVGLVMVYSSSQIIAYLSEYKDPAHFFKRQLVWAIGGLIGMVIAMNIHYDVYRRYVPIMLGGLFILMVLVLTDLGVSRNGAQRWLNLGFTNIQPSEFVKIGLIIYLASIYSKKQSYITNFKRGLIPPLIVVAIFFMLILLQRDLGTGMSVLFFTMVMIFCSGAQFRHMFGLGALTSVLFTVFVLTSDYRVKRVTSYQNPWEDAQNTGYQLIQSLIAIGNGGFTGRGFGNSIQKYLYLPEAQTDFIFAITAEELGLVGVSFILVCYALLIVRGIRAAVRVPNTFGTLLGIGIVSMIGVQALINIGVVSGRLPVTGISLPLISYGGSSLLLTLFSIGILLNISRHGRDD